jgi:NB-ARC domain
MMEETLQPGSRSREQRRVVLGGMGGIGKTQLAIAYASHYSSSYESTFWLNAASEVTLKKSLQWMAERIMEAKEYERLNEEEPIRLLRRWLSDIRNSRWLLAFDNYDEPDALDLTKYLPYNSHGSIIITTRRADQVSGKSILVRPLEDIDHSLHILATRSERDGVTTGE